MVKHESAGLQIIFKYLVDCNLMLTHNLRLIIDLFLKRYILIVDEDPCPHGQPV